MAQAFVAPRDFGSAPAQSDAMRIGLKVLFGNLEDWGAYWEARSATVHCKLIDFPAFVLLKAVSGCPELKSVGRVDVDQV